MSADHLRRSRAKEFFGALLAVPKHLWHSYLRPARHPSVQDGITGKLIIRVLCAANERTFLHWLNISVTVGSISAAMLGVSGHVHRQWGEEYQHNAVASRLLALAMMLTSILMAIYAAFLYAWRASALKCGSELSCT